MVNILAEPKNSVFLLFSCKEYNTFIVDNFFLCYTVLNNENNR